MTRAINQKTTTIDEELRRNPLFAGLDNDQLARVKDTMRSIELKEGECLFNHGQHATRFFLVRSGQIKLYRLSPDGTEKVIDIVQPMQTFAEAVMFMESRSYPVNAEALAASELIAFDSKTFLDILRESVDTCFRVMADMSMRLRMRLGEIDGLTLQNATLRLSSYLARQLPEGSQPPVQIQLSAPKNVIASRLSVQPETLSRILNNLAKAGLISVDGRTIHVLNVDALRTYCEDPNY